jgi:hypothetical protein
LFVIAIEKAMLLFESSRLGRQLVENKIVIGEGEEYEKRIRFF